MSFIVGWFWIDDDVDDIADELNTNGEINEVVLLDSEGVDDNGVEGNGIDSSSSLLLWCESIFMFRISSGVDGLVIYFWRISATSAGFLLPNFSINVVKRCAGVLVGVGAGISFSLFINVCILSNNVLPSLGLDNNSFFIESVNVTIENKNKLKLKLKIKYT